MAEQKQETPRPLLKVTYCNKCGRDNLRQRLSARHFANGSLCVGGVLKTVTYRRDDTNAEQPGGEVMADEVCEVCEESIAEFEPAILCGCEKCGRMFGPCCNSEQDSICVECA